MIKSASIRHGVRYRGIFVAVILSLTIAVAGYAISCLQEIPYNVRELFSVNTKLASLGLGVCCVLVALVPWWLADLWGRGALIPFAGSVLVTLIVVSVTFVITHFVVPIESIDDLVGTPVLNTGRTVERSLRFAGLMLGVVWSQAIGVFLAKRTAVSIWVNLLTLFGCSIGLVVSYIVVVILACTDNLTELLVGNGKDIAVVGLPLWLIVTGWTAGRWVRSFERHTISIPNWLFIGLTTIGSFAVGWIFVNMATASLIHKYGETFSAMQFLLSRDRTEYLPASQIGLRFFALHLAILLELVVGWFAYRSFVSVKSEDNVEKLGKNN